MFVINQQQRGEEKKGSSIPHHQGFDLRMHINQSLHYLYDENMQEKKELYIISLGRSKVKLLNEMVKCQLN